MSRLRLDTAFQTHRPSLPFFGSGTSDLGRLGFRPDQVESDTDEGKTSDDDSSDGAYGLDYDESGRSADLPGGRFGRVPLASRLCTERWHAIEQVQSRTNALLGTALAQRLDELESAQAAVTHLVGEWEAEEDGHDVLSTETRTLHALLLPRCAGSVRCGTMWLPVEGGTAVPLERGLLLALYAISVHAHYLNGLRVNQAVSGLHNHGPPLADRVTLELVHEAYVEAVAAQDSSSHASTVLSLVQMHYWFVRTATDSTLVNASVLSTTLFLFEALREQAPSTTLAGPIALPTETAALPNFSSPAALHHTLLQETCNAPGAIGCFAHALSELFGRADAAAPLFEQVINAVEAAPTHPFIRTANARCMERLGADVLEIGREYAAASCEGRRLCADAVVLHAAFIRRGGDADQVWARIERPWPRECDFPSAPNFHPSVLSSQCTVVGPSSASVRCTAAAVPSAECSCRPKLREFSCARRFRRVPVSPVPGDEPATCRRLRCWRRTSSRTTRQSLSSWRCSRS